MAATFAGTVRTYPGDSVIIFILSGIICFFAACLVLRSNKNRLPGMAGEAD